MAQHLEKALCWKQYSIKKLSLFSQNQFSIKAYPTSCGSFAFSILINMVLAEIRTSGEEINAYLERHLYKNPFFGIPSFAARLAARGVTKYLAEQKIDFPYTPKYLSCKSVAPLLDNLQRGIPTIIEVSWGSTRRVIHDLFTKGPAGRVGHYLVLARYSPAKDTFTFLDPGNGSMTDYSSSELMKIWLEQPNIIVRRGSAIVFK